MNCPLLCVQSAVVSIWSVLDALLSRSGQLGGIGGRIGLQPLRSSMNPSLFQSIGLPLLGPGIVLPPFQNQTISSRDGGPPTPTFSFNVVSFRFRRLSSA